MKLTSDSQKSMRSTKSRQLLKSLNPDQKEVGNNTENVEKAAVSGLIDHLLKAVSGLIDHLLKAVSGLIDHPRSRAEAQDLHLRRTAADRTEIGVGEENGVDR
jgi:gas vesicle protein